MEDGFQALYPGTSQGVRTLRREIAAMADDCGMDADTLADLRIAVTEAAANAVVHAYGASSGELSVRADVDDGELVVVIADTGRGIAAGDGRPGAGLGMPLMASLTSHFRVRTGGGGTEVRMAFPCPEAA